MSCGGVQSIFSVLEASEVKLPALRAFVLPTHFPSGSGNLTRFDGEHAGAKRTNPDVENNENPAKKLKESVVDVILKKLESIDKKVDGIQKEKGGGQKNAVEGSERSDDLDKKFKESSTVGEFEVVLESINFKI